MNTLWANIVVISMDVSQTVKFIHDLFQENWTKFTKSNYSGKLKLDKLYLLSVSFQSYYKQYSSLVVSLKGLDAKTN
jgi:hypothetical protein